MVKDKLQILPEDSSVFGEISDQECAELLREVYEKDWEQELTDFNARVMQLRIDEAVKEHVNKEMGISNSPPLGSQKTETNVGMKKIVIFFHQILAVFVSSIFLLYLSWLMGGEDGFSAVFPALILMQCFSIVLGLLALIVGFIKVYLIVMWSPFFILLCCLWLIGVGEEESSFVAWGFPALFFGLAYAVNYSVAFLQRKRIRFKKKKLTIKAQRHFREQMDTSTISPNVMIQFWGEKIETYLHKKKKIVSDKIKETSAARAKCNGLASELRNYKDEESIFSLQRLGERGQELIAIIDDATKVNGVLQKIEDKFVCHITELQTLIERQEEMERLAKRREELVKQANLLLDGTETALNDWDDGKQEIQNELFGMMNAFQRELATTKDTIRIEIKLNNA